MKSIRAACTVFALRQPCSNGQPHGCLAHMGDRVTSQSLGGGESTPLLLPDQHLPTLHWFFIVQFKLIDRAHRCPGYNGPSESHILTCHTPPRGVWLLSGVHEHRWCRQCVPSGDVEAACEKAVARRLFQDCYDRTRCHFIQDRITIRIRMQHGRTLNLKPMRW